ncbi:MAG: efflux transporter outer membrane subunit [Pseudomonadota bacterium]
MKPSLRLAGPLSLLLMTGCTTLGPDYHVPDAAVAKRASAAAPFMGADARITANNEVPGKWWQLYDDPMLNKLVEQALAANTDLRVAAANIGRADAALRGAEHARAISTQISGGAEYGRFSGEQYLVMHTLPDGGTYDIGFNAAYQLDLFGQVKRSIEAARADSEVSQATYDAVRITVAAETARAYAAVCATGHGLVVAQHALALQQQGVELTRRLFHGGRAIALDVTQSQAQLDQLQATIPALQAQQRVALYRLAVLTGKPPAAFPRQLANCTREPELKAPIPVGDGAALIKRRPDVRAAERALASATAHIGVAMADLYPKIQLGASFGSTGLTDNLFRSDTMRFGLGPLISWEFPDRERAQVRIALAKSGQQAAFARFDGAVLTALRETESALTIYSHDLLRREALRASHEQTAQALRDALTLYRLGRQAYLPVLGAERAAVASEQVLAEADSKIAADQIALFLALGGGWGADAHQAGFH